MKKLICALIGAAALVASAATYIQTSSTGTAPWRPVKDSVSQAHLADSARHAPPSAYADSSRVSGLADSAKRAGWAPLDSGRVRGIVSDTAATLRTDMGEYIPLTGSDAIDGNLSSTAGNSLGTLEKPWGLSFFRELSVDSLGVRRFYVESNGLLSWENGTQGPAIYCDWSDIYRPLHFANAPVDFDAYWIKAPQFIVRGGTAKGFLKADGSVDSSGVFAGVTDSARASHISDTAKKSGNAATATKLATARTIATSGDVTGTPTAFDGTANITIPTVLPTLLTAGSAGSATTVPTLTWDAKGRLTAVGSATISIPHTQISDWSTATSSFLTANQSISLTGAVTGSGTTSIATSFANTHLAGINQDLTTTSSPTFAKTTIAGANYTVNASASNFAAIYGSSVDAAHIAFTWALDGTQTYVNATTQLHFDIGSIDYATLTSSLFAVTPPSTFAGLITANGGISGNLTGHASLDIPLTGSSAITGALIPNGSTYTLGNSSNRWQVFGNIVSASAGFEGNLAGNVTGNVTGSASLNLLLAGGDLSGHLGLKSTQVTGSSSYAVSHSDCGTIIFQNNTYGVNITLGTNNNVGDWIISCSNGGINISGVSAKYKGVTYTNSASLASVTANVGVLKCLWDGTYWWIG